jgi:hypothetical protein
MTKYQEKIVDAITGEETFKDYTPAQLAEVKAAEIEGAKRREAKAKAEADKAALLAKLGITADEAKLLLS